MENNRSGMTPIAVCSPKNFALAKSNGAEEVFDRNDKECAQKIVSLSLPIGHETLIPNCPDGDGT